MKTTALYIAILLLGLWSCNQKMTTNNSTIQTIVLGGGCYWCVEAVYQRLNGVVDVTSGFSGGNLPDPSYEDVCKGNTGHVEVVKVRYDENKISLTQLLKVFFTIHDPTTLNRQGADVGPQYRSVIFFDNFNQAEVAKNIIDTLNKSAVYENPIVTTVEPFKNFYKAPLAHFNYYNQNKNKPYCRVVIQPKVEKFEKIFSELLKK